VATEIGMLDSRLGERIPGPEDDGARLNWRVRRVENDGLQEFR